MFIVSSSLKTWNVPLGTKWKTKSTKERGKQWQTPTPKSISKLSLL